MEGSFNPVEKNKTEKERILKLTLKELYLELLSSHQNVGRLKMLCSREIFHLIKTPDIEGFQTYGDLPIHLLIKIPMEELGKVREVGIYTIEVLKNKLAESDILMAGTNKRS